MPAVDVINKYNFDPILDLQKNDIGLLVPTERCNKEMLKEINNYFKERNEDGK